MQLLEKQVQTSRRRSCRSPSRVSSLPIPCPQVGQESSPPGLLYRVTWQLKLKDKGRDNEKAVKICYTCQKILSKRNERYVLAV